jgi:ferrous iron transport protein A
VLAEANSLFSERKDTEMTLLDAEERKEYVIKAIETDDEELDSFLFTLGCFVGGTVTVIKRRKSSCIVAIKDGRYNIDINLAHAIKI